MSSLSAAAAAVCVVCCSNCCYGGCHYSAGYVGSTAQQSLETPNCTGPGFPATLTPHTFTELIHSRGAERVSDTDNNEREREGGLGGGEGRRWWEGDGGER